MESKAVSAVKAMTDVLNSTRAFRFKTRCTWDAVQDFDMKLQVDAVQEIMIRRPGQLYAATTRDDGATNQFWFDNGSLAYLSDPSKEYVRITTPKTIDAMLDHLLEKYNIPSPPMLDFLYEDAETSFLKDVDRAYHIGTSYVHGQSCHHIAVSKDNVDYQLWLPVVGTPLPVKYAITWRDEPLMPSFTARFLEWDTDPKFSHDQFEFTPPTGAIERVLPPAGKLGETSPGDGDH
jgi:hypothetical protein